MNSRTSSTIKPPVTRKHVLEFGKHKGKSIEWLLGNDPSYIVWMKDNNVMNIPDEIYFEADDNDNIGWDSADVRYPNMDAE